MSRCVTGYSDKTSVCVAEGNEGVGGRVFISGTGEMMKHHPGVFSSHNIFTAVQFKRGAPV